MSDPKPSKKRGVLRLLVTIGGVLLLVGGGVGIGVFVARSGAVAAPSSHSASAEEPAASERHYFAPEQGFTANLRGSDSFVQASVAMSTRSEKLAEALKSNEPALRSVVLQVLAEETYDTASTATGRKALQKRLRAALDEEARTKIGFGGIENVYFTAFVVQ